MGRCNVSLIFTTGSLLAGIALVAVAMTGPWMELSYRLDAYLARNNFEDADSSPEKLAVIEVIGDPRETTDLCVSFKRGLWKYFADAKECDHLNKLGNHRQPHERLCGTLLLVAMVCLCVGLLCIVMVVTKLKVFGNPTIPLLVILLGSVVLVIVVVAIYPSKRTKYPTPLENVNQYGMYSEGATLLYGYTVSVFAVAILVCSIVLTACSLGLYGGIGEDDDDSE